MLTIWGESREYPVVVSYDADNAAPWSCTVTTPGGDMATASGGSIETAMAGLAVSVSDLDSFVREKGAQPARDAVLKTRSGKRLMTTRPLVPCPDCGDVPSLWGDADPLRLLGMPVKPYLYIACDCGMTGPVRRSKRAAIRAWSKMLEMFEDAEKLDN